MQNVTITKLIVWQPYQTTLRVNCLHWVQSINAVANFLEVFFTDWWTDRQTDRQTSTQTRFALAAHTHKQWFPDPQLYWGSGNKTLVLLCVCTVFSDLKLFIVQLAVFTAGSKPTSKAKLFPHISRWWELTAAFHPVKWLSCPTSILKKFLGGPACEAIVPYNLITHTHTLAHTHTHLAAVSWVLLLSTCERNSFCYNASNFQ